MKTGYSFGASLLALAGATALGAISTAAYADTFINGSFETGDLTGWTSGGGTWTGGPYPVPGDYLPGGSASTTAGLNTVTNAGFDANTDGNLRTAYAGAHSVQVNNSFSDDSVSVISQRVNNYTDPLIAFAYAAVLQSSHGLTDSDAFIITLTDATTNESLFSFNLNSAAAPGLFTQSSAGWYYTDWVEQSIDVSGRQGHDFVLSLLANDCPYGGHAGYAYLDGFGSVVGGGGTGGGATVTYWDGSAAGNADNGVVDGGDGIWVAGPESFSNNNGSTNEAYPQAANVVFQGAPGTVTVDDSGGQIVVGGLTFNVSGYKIVGDSITLDGNVSAAVGSADPATSGYVATIDSVLEGAGALTKDGAGTLVLGGVNTYSGGTVVAAGTLTGAASAFGDGAIAIGDAGALLVNQPADATLANPISGSGLLAKTGPGTLTLTGADAGFDGNTGVLGGTLLVNTDLGGSAVTVASGATLGGTGIVNSVTALSGATVAPGNKAIGTLSVNGNVNQQAGSTYAVELTSAGASDLILADSATIAPGAKLVVTKLDTPRYVLGKRYTVVTTAGGVTGAYQLSGNTNVSLFYDLVGRYDANHVYLDVAQTHSFASVGATPNQIAAAGGADSTLVTGPLHTAIGYLQTVPEARAAFDSISGEVHATARAAALEDSRFVREAVYNHLDSATDKALWFHGFGSWGHQKGDGNAARYDRDIYGAFLGADVIQSGLVRIGLVAGYAHSKLKIPERDSRARSNDISLGAYGALDSAGFAIRVGGNYVFRQVKTSRTVSFTGFSDTDTAKYTLGIGQAYGEIGYKIGAGGFTLEPFANIAYVDVSSGHEFETGGAASLELFKQHPHTVFTNLGGRVSVGAGGFKITGSGAWRHAADSHDVTTPLAFASGGSTFVISAPPLAKDVAAVELLAEGKIGPRTTLSVGYSGQIGDNLRDHGGKASVSFAF